MKAIHLFFGIALIAASCGGGEKGSVGSQDVKTFDSLITTLNDEQLIDVRTPEEYAGGHLISALNYDWNNADFAINVGALDKSKPVLVYCRSGNRSKDAADHLRSNGFTAVYELDGGISAWEAAGKPTEKEEVETTTTTNGVSLTQYNSVLAENDVVLVDFTATWCGPCKILAPSLHELESELSGKFVLLTVDVDRDRPVAEFMNIAAMPTLILYKKGQIQWRNEGVVPKDMVAEKINGAQ